MKLSPSSSSVSTTVNRSTIEQIVARDFPGWTIASIYEARLQGEVYWDQLLHPENSPERITELINRGYEEFQFHLTHPLGGETYPSYTDHDLERVTHCSAGGSFEHTNLGEVS